MQKSIQDLVGLGVFPKTEDLLNDPKGEEHLNKMQALLESIELPVTNDEAVALCSILGDEEWDDCFGLTQTLMRIVETAPDWPIKSLFIDNHNFWMGILKNRSRLAW